MPVSALWLYSHSLLSWPSVVFFVAAFCHPSDSQVEITFAYTHALSLSLSVYPQPSSGNHTTNMAICHRVFVKKHLISKKNYGCILRWTLQFASERFEVTNTMEQSPSWEANWFSAGQEIPRILWNPKAHYRIHLSLFWAREIQYLPHIPLSEDPF